MSLIFNKRSSKTHNYDDNPRKKIIQALHFIEQCPAKNGKCVTSVLLPLTQANTSSVVSSADTPTLAFCKFHHHGCSSCVRSYFASLAADNLSSIYCRLLPQPFHAASVSDDEKETQPTLVSRLATTVITRTVAPPYGQRSGWKPSSLEDFGALVYSVLVCDGILNHEQATVAHTQNALSPNIPWGWARSRCAASTLTKTATDLP